MSGELLDEVIRMAVMAADMEALGPVPRSSVRNPDGSIQGETEAERTRRLVNAAIRHSVKSGLLMVAPDAEARLEGGIDFSFGPGPRDRITSTAKRGLG
jgi:hypothetical protein